jgi:serine/threonine-protein kinase
MAGRVELEVVQGVAKGKKYVFEERTMCVMGRAKDCQARILVPKDRATVSRHHCLLDINPPDVRIRDFGSLNGTFVNGKKIGQRKKGRAAGGVEWTSFPEHDLQHGDKIRLGKSGNTLRVTIFQPTVREPAAHALRPERRTAVEVDPATDPQPQSEPPPYRPITTISVRAAGGPAGVEPVAGAVPPGADGPNLGPLPLPSPEPPRRECARCGRDVSAELSDRRAGEYICAACRSDPFQLMKALLQQAGSGDSQLVSIRGYRIQKELGRGGMGAVYLAEHEGTGKTVALKVMLPKIAADERANERFLRETVNTQSLQHRNIVRLYDSGCSCGTFFFTLEFCDRGSASRLMKRRGGKLAIAEAGPIILQVLDGLAYAHAAPIPYVKLKDGRFVPGRGLVHRDIKPENVFLRGPRSKRAAKLGDYGLAKAFDLAGLSGHTYTGDVAGTPHFMPRQQVVNFLDAGPEVDVWATAATLYCMLTGNVPRDFSRKHVDPWQVVLQTDAVPIRQRDRQIPEKLAAVIDFALRDKPQIGFQTAFELKRALEEVL